MKNKTMLMLLGMMLIAQVANAGCTPDGKCLAQVNTMKQLEQFINEHPYQIESVSLRMGHYYIWYKLEGK